MPRRFNEVRPFPASAWPMAGQPWLWMAGFAGMAGLLSLEALTPIVPGTTFSLISLPVALLAFAVMVRPWAEAPFYALIHAAAGVVLHAGIEYPAFTALRTTLEIVEVLLLVWMLRAYFFARLGDPLFVALYTVAILALTGLGGLAILASAQLLPALGFESPPILAERPALAWRHWWLSHGCSYMLLASQAAVILYLRRRLVHTLLEDRAQRRTFLLMASALLAASMLAFPIVDLSWLGLPADVRQALHLVPLPFALAMAMAFRANGGSSATIILTLVVILSLTGPNADANWAEMQPTATPTQALLLITATTCMVIGAMSRQLLKATADAFEARQAKSRFVSMLNHELRTPLNAILGFSELMRVHKVHDIEEAMGPFENIHASGQRLLAMIEGLLAQADQGASAFELEKHSLKLSQFVTNVVDELQPELVAFRYPIAIAIPDELQIDADEKALHQILLVLLSYPLRFVTPWTTVSVTANQSGTDTIFEIDSHGLVGAANDDRDKLELQLVEALALAHGARLHITNSEKDRRHARLTFFATRAAAVSGVMPSRPVARS